MPYKYFIETNDEGKREVTREEWIQKERQCGFKPKLSSTDPMYYKVCATSGFGASAGNGHFVNGSIKFFPRGKRLIQKNEKKKF